MVVKGFQRYFKLIALVGTVILVLATVKPVYKRADGFLNIYSEKKATPKKVAILFSGRIKGYQHVIHKLLEIKNKYYPVIFCSLNEVEYTQDIHGFCEALNIPKTKAHVNIEQTVLPDWADKCNMMNPTLNVYSMFYHENKAYSMLEEYMNNNEPFDCVLLYRADMDSTDVLELTVPEKNTIYLPKDREYGGYNDRMAYGDVYSMKIYCNLINVFENLCSGKDGDEVNPETMLNRYLKLSADIKVVMIDYNTDLHQSRNDKFALGIFDR
jgi:hypothetical protein